MSEAKKVPCSDAMKWLVKSRENLAAAVQSLEAGRWNAAGLSAIHAGINAGDAALAHVAGLRSVAQDHGALISLLSDHVPAFAAPQGRHLAGLLKMKNLVAYEQRLLTEAEARRLVDHARRLFRWCEETLAAKPG